LYDILKATDKYDESKAVMAHVKLHNLIKSEDWFKDGGTIVKTLRKGRGRTPFVDSAIKFRMQVLVGDKEVVNNFPTLPDWNFETSEDLA
jgi:tetratricopeptide (TPR) repeat protein